ncbi:MAG: DNA-binding protein [Opitutae bacterium]|nr:DNA-binding protein [Opitutae bacterium]|tara:strand:+ start:3559 stop:3948 length:390 start_codon:yes stop_codon:yes gene_type:complete
MINLDESYATDSGKPLFEPGELVMHKHYGYRGVIVSLDLFCKANEEWYQSNKTQPTKNQPWYHVLVDQEAHVTYSAQSNLLADETAELVTHPMTKLFFSGFEGGRYIRNEVPWNPGEPPDMKPPPPPSS